MFGLSVGGHLGSFADVSGAEGNGECSSGHKDGSETYTSSSSTSETSQDEALKVFDKSLELEDTNANEKGSNNDVLIDKVENNKVRTLSRPQRPRPYTKSHSEPILNVKPCLRQETAIEERISEDDSERSGDYEQLYQGNDELDGGDFHWVREDECSSKEKGFAEGYLELSEGGVQWTAPQTKEDVDEFFKPLSRRMPFRQRACAMKKKCKRRSSSVPTITCLPEKDVQTNNEMTEK
jgi:hypothetical protein